MSDNTPASVAALAAAHDSALVTMGFGNLQSFEFMQRTAKLFATSTMVPSPYQAVVSKGYGQNQKWEQNPAALSNCMIALDLAQRMNVSPLQVMQNLHVIEGRPSWSSPFIIALINNCGLYAHNLRFRLEWLDEIDAIHTVYEWNNNASTEVQKTVRVQNARCIAWTKDKGTGEVLESPPVTLELAVNEGWYTRKGSKWRSMSQLMLQYRAAAFFGRANNPELLMGLPTVDEIHDVIDVERQPDGTYAAPAPTAETTAATVAAVPKPRAPRPKATTTAIDAANVTEVPVVEEVMPSPERGSVAEAKQSAAAPTGEASEDSITEARALENQQRLANLTASTAMKAPPDLEAQPETEATIGKLLSAPKISFVRTSLENGGLSSTDLQRKFGVTPDELTDTMFPLVLAWFKDPTK